MRKYTITLVWCVFKEIINMSTRQLHSHIDHDFERALQNSLRDQGRDYENVVHYFEKMYPEPRRDRINRFIAALKRACPNCTTKEVKGDGDCMIRALDATLPDWKVNRDDADKFLSVLDQDLLETCILVGEISRDDLKNDKKNDLSINWLDGIAIAYGINITVLVEQDGQYSIHTSVHRTKYLKAPTYYLLRHNNHFWPLLGDPPNIDRWVLK